MNQIRTGMRRLLLWGLLALLLAAGVLPAGAEGAGEWHFDENGFLTGENPAAEYVRVNEKDGLWQYAGADLSVVIRRYQETVTYKGKKRIREYCIADIHASPASPLNAIQSQPTTKRPAGYLLVSPEKLMEAHPTVFALSDDLYGIRLQKYDYQGVVIRNGEILANKARDSSTPKYVRAWPNLDTLAVYADGSMKTFVCDAHTPEEYLAQGAVHVFSFGPSLVSEGAVSPRVMNAMNAGYNEPRCAIGMVEPWHYIAIVVRGRPTDQYAGVHLDWLADKMLELGCVEAINLDGGLTATMAFRGKIIETGGATLRSQGSMITFGEGLGPEPVPEVDENGRVIRLGKTAKATVRVRKGASARSSLIATLTKKGTEVTVLGEETDADGALWYQIRTEGGREGYIRGDLLAVE